ncbi:MAG: sigma 54-interacting transcriptional regulator [Bacteroidota bacterium]
MDNVSTIHQQLTELYKATLDNLSEGIVITDLKAEIVYVNNTACDMYGYTPEEMLGRALYELAPNNNLEDWKNRWFQVFELKELHQPCKLLCKDGRIAHVDTVAKHITWQGKKLIAFHLMTVLDTQDHNEMLRIISEGTASVVGGDFFQSLAYHLIATTGIRYAIVTECTNSTKTRLRTLVYIERDQFLDNIEYDLDGTPCEIIMKGDSYYCTADLDVLFPKEEGIKSYFGVPILLSDGEIIGHIAIFDTKPMVISQQQLNILKIFASRAAAEIERKRKDEEIRENITELKLAQEQLNRALTEVKELKEKLEAENIYLQEEIKHEHNFEEIVSQSDLFKKVLEKVQLVAQTDATVLILGESGTGKELIARAIHSISKRSNRPLVKVNCATLPANLIESELFGHEKGAFTGATTQKIGRFELADGGTIFLDEIGEMPLELQAKLLRVLQEGEFERVGNSRTMRVDVRVITATNRDLQQSVNNKEFRTDLYYRLNVFPVYTPPLRERKEDIPILVNHFCRKYGMKFGKRVNTVSKAVLEALMKYDWPGNIRELENIIERGLIISSSDHLELGDWLPKPQIISTDHKHESATDQSLEVLERTHILQVLQKTNWKIRGEGGAAKILSLNPTTLEARMKKLGIVRAR